MSQPVTPKSALRRTVSIYLVTSLLGSLLVGCQQTPSAPQAAGADAGRFKALSLGGSDPGVLTVMLSDQDALSDQALEQEYRAELLERTEDFALLLPRPVMSAQSLTGVSSVTSEDGQATLETERATIHAQQSVAPSGTVGIWGDGTVGIWGSGQSAAQANAKAYRQADLPRAQQQLTRLGQGMRVAVIDSGLDLAHPNFQGKLCGRSTWRDIVDNDAWPQDTTPDGQVGSGHGTAVASLILQAAPNACVMPVRVLDAQGNGNTSDLARAILWAVCLGADIINLSIGSGQHLEAVEQTIRYANRRGVMVTAASGNAGKAGLDFPAADFAPGSLNVAVGSLSPQGTRSNFSQYAPGLLLAPGEGLVAAMPGERQAAWTGSSFSTALVSGMLALSRAEGKPAAALGQAVSRTPGVQDQFHAINADALLP